MVVPVGVEIAPEVYFGVAVGVGVVGLIVQYSDVGVAVKGSSVRTWCPGFWLRRVSGGGGAGLQCRVLGSDVDTMSLFRSRFGVHIRGPGRRYRFESR